MCKVFLGMGVLGLVGLSVFSNIVVDFRMVVVWMGNGEVFLMSWLMDS